MAAPGQYLRDRQRRSGDTWRPSPGERREQLAAVAGVCVARFFDAGDPDELRRAAAALEEAIAIDMGRRRVSTGR